MRDAPVSAWMAGNRPILQLSFWLNLGNNPLATGAFHRVNVLIHCLNALLLYLILRRFLPENRWTATVLAGVFLVHPLQTESVAYIAGRSESLAAFFCLAAYAVYVYRPAEGALSWRRATAVLGLYATAVLTKENAVVLPALLLLTDWAGGRSWRMSLRVYVPIAVLAAAGVLMVARVLGSSRTAGFASPIAPWDEYALTQARAVPQYFAMILLPLRQSMDHDFAFSKSLTDRQTWLYLLLLVGAAGGAWALRKRFPLGALGVFWFFVCLAPTSSFVPIADPFVERRAYLATAGVLFVAAEALRRVRLSAWTATALAIGVLSGYAALTYQRNVVMRTPLTIWVEAVQHGSTKGRPYEFLADAAVHVEACADVEPFLRDAVERMPRNLRVLRGAAKVLECMDRPDEATALLRRAVTLDPKAADIYELLGLVYGARNELEKARPALEAALRLKPDSPAIQMSMALWYQAAKDWPKAAAGFRRVLQLEPSNTSALVALRQIEGNPAPAN